MTSALSVASFDFLDLIKPSSAIRTTHHFYHCYATGACFCAPRPHAALRYSPSSTITTTTLRRRCCPHSFYPCCCSCYCPPCSSTAPKSVMAAAPKAATPSRPVADTMSELKAAAAVLKYRVPIGSGRWGAPTRSFTANMASARS